MVLAECIILSEIMDSTTCPCFSFKSNIKFPKYMANVYAASFPEGSIIPYRSSWIDILSPASSSADVPPKKGVVLDSKTLILVETGSILNLSIKSKTTHIVTILVKDATYLWTVSCFANMISPVSIFIINHERAETNGAGLSKLYNFVIDFRYSP